MKAILLRLSKIVRTTFLFAGLCIFVIPVNKIHAQFGISSCLQSSNLLTSLVDTNGGILICCTANIPICPGGHYNAACSCIHAFTHRYIHIANELKWCPKVVITGVSVNFKKDPNSTQWMICHPLKNFGSDCYTNEWGISVTGSSETAVGSCLNFPPQDTTKFYENTVNFIPPTRPLYTGRAPDSCTSMTDLNWEIPVGDHFSFEIYGAADSTAANDGDADGMDFFVDFKDYSTSFPYNEWSELFHATECLADCTTIYPCTD
jgi:hypothetical protein